MAFSKDHAPHPRVVDPQHPAVVRVRVICMEFPDAVEVEVWGRPTFRATKKIFVTVGSSMQRPLSVVFKPDKDERRARIQDPRFFVPPYFGPGGWLAIDIDEKTSDWQEIAEIIDMSYRQVALVRQVKALNSRSPKPLV